MVISRTWVVSTQWGSQATEAGAGGPRRAGTSRWDLLTLRRDTLERRRFFFAEIGSVQLGDGVSEPRAARSPVCLLPGAWLVVRLRNAWRGRR